jgi:putative oxidoreductase
MSTTASWIILFGRIVFVVFFVNSALGHLLTPQNTIAYARADKMPFPILAGYPAGLWLAGGSALVTLGAWPDLGCLMLAAFVIRRPRSSIAIRRFRLARRAWPRT